MALNDEAGVVRALAIRVVGRLAGRNPAYVMPALRRHLMQLLSDMDHLPDSRHREGAHLPANVHISIRVLQPSTCHACIAPPPHAIFLQPGSLSTLQAL